MARLPSSEDMQRRLPTGAEQDIRVRPVDYGSVASAAGAVGQGLSDVSKGLQAADKYQSEVDDFQTRKKTLDFKLASEMALEDYKRQMPLGGEGYAASWADQYKKMANDFVGADDANIPASQRAKVGLVLKQNDVMLQERAQRDQNAEQDRHTILGLKDTVTNYKSRVEANPARHDEVQAELETLINGAPITPAQRSTYAKEVKASVSEAAAIGMADGIRTAEDRDKVKALLAPSAPDKRDPTGLKSGASLAPNYIDAIKQSEGFSDKTSWDYKQYSNGYGTRAKFPGETIDKAEAETRLNAELGKASSIVDTFKPDLDQGTRAALISLTYNAGDEWTRSGLGKAVQSGDLGEARRLFLQYNKAGGKTLLADRRQREAQWIGTGGGGNTAPIEPSLDTEPEYGGPFAALPLAKRRAIWAKAEGNFRTQVTNVETVLKGHESGALQGRLPSEGELAAISRTVEGIADPALTAKYNAFLAKADMSSRIYQAPSAVVAETWVRSLEQNVRANGSSQEAEAILKHAKEQTAELAKNINENPNAWAMKTGVVVPFSDGPPADLDPGQKSQYKMPVGRVELKPLNFDNPDIDLHLAERAEQAKAVSRYYNQPPQIFTSNEREALKDNLRLGGDKMINVLGRISKASVYAGVDPMAVMKEFTKDAPEVAMVGELIVNNGDARLIDTAAKAIKWRVDMGDKFDSSIDKAQTKPDLAEFAPVLGTQPQKVDPVKHLANIVYEYEARQKGLKDFDLTTYHGVVRRIFGETTDADGNAYGGVGKQGAGWFDGKWSSQVLVPAEVRQDRVDAMIGAVRADDLKSTPRDASGLPLSIGEIRGATWVSVGAGKYELEMKRDPDGTRVVALDDAKSTYVLDIRPLLQDIKKRRPDIFRGYTGNEIPKSGSDGAYPSWLTHRPAAPLPNEPIGVQVPTP